MKITLQELRKKIDSAARAYYGEGTSTLSDAEYDSLIGLLRELCPEDPRLTSVGPIYSTEELKNKFQHRIPMGSLDNTENGISGFKDWYEKTCNEYELCISHKVDGNSVAAYYEDGELVRVLTRGDGSAGDDITANAVLWPGLPTSLSEPLTISVRGEAVLPKLAFDQLNSDNQYNNPRNLCAGVINRKSEPDQNRFIEFHVFNTDTDLPTLSARLEHAKSLGFQVVWHKVASADFVHECFLELEDKAFGGKGLRCTLPYEIDGLVVAINDLKLQEALIEDDNDRLRPKHSRAIKFVTLKAQTKVIGCQITLGHTGALIPTADLEPTPIGGVTVDSALLNNWNIASSFPSAAHIAIGDIVEIERAGDVIPKIVRVVTPVYRDQYNGFVGNVSEIEEKYGNIGYDGDDTLHTEHCSDKRRPYVMVVGEKRYLHRPIIQEPKIWEGKPTTRFRRGREMASTYVDLGSDHAAIRKQKIKHWINKIGILGIGDGVLDAMVTGETPLVYSPADLYRVTEQQLADLRIGSNGSYFWLKRARELCRQIHANKSLPLPKFLGALGIDLLGSRRAEIIAKEQNLATLEDWLDNTKLEAIPGDVTRHSIVNGLYEANAIIEDLLYVGVVALPLNDKKDEKMSSTTSLDLTGKSFCFTGIRDAEAEAQIEAAGGVIKSGVSKNLTHLVQKDPTSQSTKSRKADELGVKVISIDTLKAVLSGERQLP